MESNKTILITGGAGYIGSHTIIELLETTPFNIVSIDNYSNSSSETFARIERITGKKITNYPIDICNKKELETVFLNNTSIIGIIHFAAFKAVGESVENPQKYYHNNINSLLNILDCAVKYNVKNFIFSSSCSVYGNIKELPVKETTPLGKAESPYAYTKQVGEEILKDYAKANPKLQTIALRYFNPVGAHLSGFNGESPINKPNNLVPIITNTAIGKLAQMTVYGNNYPTRDGTCIRDYVHVSDIATAHIKALTLLIENKNDLNFSIFNLGTGNGVSVLEAIAAFEKVSGTKLNYKIGPIREGDVGAIYSDNSLSEKTLNWTPKFSLDDMMSSAWKWELEQQNAK
ncbi:MAG: UDP-glucose 4-epimerase GalE [Bacteroidetes bacterium]|nr:UDP-glucose 4-epimerase GalE [Bacteroidota bacterium]